MCLTFSWSQRHKKRTNSPSPLNASYPSLVTFPGKASGYLQVFSYEELEMATNHFDPSNKLGDGGSGILHIGKLPDGRIVAIKRLYENNNRRFEQFMTEIGILARMRHKNLVSLYGCTTRHSRELLLVYEYIPKGTVCDHLHGRLARCRDRNLSLPWRTRVNIAVETASALAYLHESGVIHRDVKTDNILLDNDFTVKVADFGLSRFFPNDISHVSTAAQGTPGYLDPEHHQCFHLSDKSDVCSFGVVLIELLSSKPAVDFSRNQHKISLSSMAIVKIQNGELHELVDQDLGYAIDNDVRKMICLVAELAFRCLQPRKDMRPSMQEVLNALMEIQKMETISSNILSPTSFE